MKIKENKMKTKFMKLLWLLAVISILFTGCELLDSGILDEIPGISDNGTNENPTDDGGSGNGSGDTENTAPPSVTLDSIPEFDGQTAYVIINDNVPFFTDEDTSKSYEYYSPLDSLGRCGEVIACIGRDLMPTESRGDIGSVKPSGWQSVKYDNVDGQYLYNRCHLIGFQLTGENANKQNLITGTRFLNVMGMLQFENMVADYVKETGNRVLYRVTPIFDGDDLVARGVLMEAMSAHDGGEDLQFCIYAYNCQPGIVINYADGTSYRSDEEAPEIDNSNTVYILNTRSLKIHRTTCPGVQTMSEGNKKEHVGDFTELLAEGYTTCGTCQP